MAHSSTTKSTVTSNITTLDLLRHGKLDTPGIFCAEASTPVSAEGMQDLINTTKDGSWDIIISSPQQRCVVFAQKLSKDKNCPLVIDDRFKEMNFGDWVGKKSDELWQQYPEQYQQLWQTPDDFVAINGESMQQFAERIHSGLQDILSSYQNQSILVITHGGVIRQVLSKALDLDTLAMLKFSIHYAQLNRLFCYEDGNFSLEFLGRKN
ncbi:histidine phosphatase family protein [Cocleimonas flava]|uniref:Alpha-ribazole phosphatase n=1 Tax=Cocleimonas flava TaxID=634765 RepID=A0A4R1F5A1_9GAMM|nr:histidine phosphatase family protein [Cocleimonas flava]TCJ88570.1 alpha-ribazole phosphatase [Cocleimonas flava]